MYTYLTKVALFLKCEECMGWVNLYNGKNPTQNPRQNKNLKNKQIRKQNKNHSPGLTQQQQSKNAYFGGGRGNARRQKS